MLPQSLPFCPRYFWRYSAVPIDHSTQFFPFHFSSFLYVWTRGVPYYQSPQPLKINKIKIWRRKVADEKPAHTEKDKKNQKKEVEAETAAPALAVLYKSRPPSAPLLPFLRNLAAVSRNLSRPNSNRRPLQISAQGEEDPSIYPRLFLPPFVNWIRSDRVRWVLVSRGLRILYRNPRFDFPIAGRRSENWEPRWLDWFRCSAILGYEA
jgi:hypothetical protein